jgi:hypothetical protein
MLPGCKLYCSIWQGQVLGFEPDLLALFVVCFCQGFIVCECVEGASGKDSVLYNCSMLLSASWLFDEVLWAGVSGGSHPMRSLLSA